MTQPLEDMRADVAEIKALMYQALNGNPAAGQPGIWIRLDRVEQIVRVALWVAGLAITAAVTAVVSAFRAN